MGLETGEESLGRVGGAREILGGVGGAVKLASLVVSSPMLSLSLALSSSVISPLFAVQSRLLDPSLRWDTNEVMVSLISTLNSGLGALSVLLAGSSTGRAGETGWLVVCQSSTSLSSSSRTS